MRTITIAGRAFPMVNLVCPPVEGETETDWDRSLGFPHGAYIPAENGLIFDVEPDGKGTWTLGLYARSCFLHELNGEAHYLPHAVYLVDGKLVTWKPTTRRERYQYPEPGPHLWLRAEAEWVVETIDRLSRKPFTQPPGPLMELRDPEEVLDGAP